MTWSTLPLPFASCITIAVRTGAAPSVGVVAAKVDWLLAASRMPLALVARAMVKVLTAVSAAPAPSLRVRVAVVPATATEARVPALGMLASVQGAVPAV